MSTKQAVAVVLGIPAILIGGLYALYIFALPMLASSLNGHPPTH